MLWCITGETDMNMRSSDTPAPRPQQDRPARLPPVIGWLRRALKVTERLSPALAAEFARFLFFKPMPSKVRAEERAVLATGQKLHLSVGGAKVTAWSWGQGPAVLLCHGWGGHAGQMTALVQPLTSSGYRVIAVDMPGHGQSAGNLSDVLQFAAAVRAAADMAGGLAGAVAHSLGAAAVAVACAEGLRVPRLVFFSPPLDFEGFWSRFREMFEVGPALWERMRASAERRLGKPLEQTSPRPHVARLEGALLVFHDEGDREIPLAQGEALARQWRGAAFVRTQGLGHMRILKDPELAKRAAAFLAGAQSS
jgi:pimeloyl-ACP methyl ester carboxylesterase